MSSNLKVCDVKDDLAKRLKDFKFRKAKTNAAIVLKVCRNTFTIEEEEFMEDMTLEELHDVLPSHEPRYVVLSYVYNHPDGRVSYPLCSIFISPSGCNPEQQMMYAGSYKNFVKEMQITKVFETRSPDDINEEWINEKLAFFK